VIADALPWDLMLRGGVAGILLFHFVNLALPGSRPAVRAALAVFTLSLLAYLFCQRAALMTLVPAPIAYGVLALCVSATAWLWLAARALFNDRFRWAWPTAVPAIGMVVLGTAAAAPRLAALLRGAADPGHAWLGGVHALAMVGFTLAALWEVLRGWRDDLVEPRRAARRWAALGIGVYAALALAVELAVRDRPVDPLLPALHVLGIGSVAMALAVLVARRSLDLILGLPPAATVPEIAAAAPAAPELEAPAEEPPALRRLRQAMSDGHAYRREGLTLAALAADLGLGEAALRSLINQHLGYRNFNDFLHHHRLQEAAGRLTTEDLPILTIALDCGYGSIGPFNRAFRQRFGMTPTAYRAAARMTQSSAAG
jgi:AraC-like DNA-binding protein